MAYKLPDIYKLLSVEDNEVPLSLSIDLTEVIFLSAIQKKLEEIAS